ncbi:MAG: mechanosensitive ion channel family protein, partial [Candidatus Bipolaricaulia bacterium]
MDVLTQPVYGNTLLQWGIAIAVVVGVFIGLRLLIGQLIRRLSTLATKSETEIDDLVVKLIDRTKWLVLLAVAIYAGSLALTLPADVESLIAALVVIALLVQLAFWASEFLSFWIDRQIQEHVDEDAATATTLSALHFVGKLLIWTIAFLLSLANLGINISALIAGLGVGGIAVALALQGLLTDLFASLSIVMDKPFVIGDFVIVGEYMGNIEHIGLKTTRVRSLSGEQLIFSNNDMLNSRIRNYKRMEERRILFTIGVTYDTPSEKLERIPTMIREIIESQNLTRFDRSHFKSYGDFALIVESVYYVLSPDYYVYM